MSRVRGLLLAAGAGRRFGGPKALARDADADGTPWLALAAETLEAAGLEVLAVLPASCPESRDLLPASATGLLVETVDEGLSASLRAGLAALAATPTSAALITLVDLPGLPVEVLRRILSPAPPAQMKENSAETAPDPHERVTEDRVLLHSGSKHVLRRAVFDGRPGHPVLIGRAHWPALWGTLAGDTGAGAYLRAHGTEEIECSDLWDGADVDEPDSRDH